MKLLGGRVWVEVSSKWEACHHPLLFLFCIMIVGAITKCTSKRTCLCDMVFFRKCCFGWRTCSFYQKLFSNCERNHAFRSYEQWSTFLIRKELSISFLTLPKAVFCQINQSMNSGFITWGGGKEADVLWNSQESIVSGQMWLKRESVGDDPSHHGINCAL